MNIKQVFLAVIGIVWIFSLQSVAIANSDGYADSKQMGAEKMHEHMHENMQHMLDKLAGRLEIKASQQGAWDEFSKSIGVLSEQNVKKPGEDADAATISRFHADRAADIAKKLAKIAEATAKLQSVLTEDQRKILNQASRHFLHNKHGWNKDSNMHSQYGRADNCGAGKER